MELSNCPIVGMAGKAKAQYMWSCVLDTEITGLVVRWDSYKWQMQHFSQQTISCIQITNSKCEFSCVSNVLISIMFRFLWLLEFKCSPQIFRVYSIEHKAIKRHQLSIRLGWIRVENIWILSDRTPVFRLRQKCRTNFKGIFVRLPPTLSSRKRNRTIGKEGTQLGCGGQL